MNLPQVLIPISTALHLWPHAWGSGVMPGSGACLGWVWVPRSLGPTLLSPGWPGPSLMAASDFLLFSQSFLPVVWVYQGLPGCLLWGIQPRLPPPALHKGVFPHTAHLAPSSSCPTQPWVLPTLVGLLSSNQPPSTGPSHTETLVSPLRTFLSPLHLLIHRVCCSPWAAAGWPQGRAWCWTGVGQGFYQISLCVAMQSHNSSGSQGPAEIVLAWATVTWRWGRAERLATAKLWLLPVCLCVCWWGDGLRGVSCLELCWLWAPANARHVLQMLARAPDILQPP